MTVRTPVPWRSTALGVIAGFLGALLWLAAIGLSLFSAAYLSFGGGLEGVAGLPLAILAFVGGWLLIALGRQLRAKSALDVMANDTRPPVLYCRSFSVDEPMTGFEDAGEIQLAQAFSAVGPVVAIGKPGDRLRVPGAARSYVEGEDWQPEVERLMDRSRLVIFKVSISDGLLWEYKTALERVPPNRIVLVPPEDRDVWQDFIDATGHDTLPADLQTADMICLDTEGQGRRVWRTNTQLPWWEDRQLIQRLLFKSSF